MAHFSYVQNGMVEPGRDFRRESALARSYGGSWWGFEGLTCGDGCEASQLCSH